MMNSIQDGVSDRGKKQRSESQKKKDLTQPYHLYAEQNVNQTSTGPITWGPMHDERLHLTLPVGKKSCRPDVSPGVLCLCLGSLMSRRRNLG